MAKKRKSPRRLRLDWYSNRSTAVSRRPGEKRKPKKGFGRLVKTTTATARQDRILRKGQWLRDRMPGGNPKKRSSYRKGLGRKQKASTSKRSR